MPKSMRHTEVGQQDPRKLLAMEGKELVSRDVKVADTLSRRSLMSNQYLPILERSFKMIFASFNFLLRHDTFDVFPSLLQREQIPHEDHWLQLFLQRVPYRPVQCELSHRFPFQSKGIPPTRQVQVLVFQSYPESNIYIVRDQRELTILPSTRMMESLPATALPF